MSPGLRLLAILLMFPAAAAAEPPVGQPDVRVGDQWTFQQQDGFTQALQGVLTRRVVAVSATEITAVTQVEGRPGETVGYFSRDWNVVDNGAAKIDPSNLTLRMPMKTGDTWHGQYHVRTLSNGNTMVCEISAKVALRETVKVPAGSFDALRIDGQSECRGANPNATPITLTTTNWYAPAAKNIVKTVFSTMFEGRERTRQVVEMRNYFLTDRREPAPTTPDDAPSARTPVTPSTMPAVPPAKGI